MIGIVGLGFVGLTAALGFAHKGYKVFAFDHQRSRMDQIRKGAVPFHEPFLGDALKRHLGELFFVCDQLADVIRNCELVFYCVGTPCRPDGRADLSLLLKAVGDSLPFIEPDTFKVLVVKSTVPPTSTCDLVKPLIEKENFIVGKNIGLANAPEFLREGCAWEDFTNPDRIVIGECEKKSGDAVARAFEAFNAPIYRVSPNTAEYIKYLSNSLLSTLISFSNEMAMIADAIGGIDIAGSFSILHEDRRWTGAPGKMSSYVYPGCGFGGYCLPKDTAALSSLSADKGYESVLLKDVLSINDMIKRHVADKVAALASGKEKVVVLGLSFKPESDDVRETPAADIIRLLIERGVERIIAYDPLAVDNFRNAFNLPIEYTASFEESVAEGDIFVVATAWPEFERKKELLRAKTVIDGRFFLSL